LWIIEKSSRDIRGRGGGGVRRRVRHGDGGCRKRGRNAEAKDQEVTDTM
jgi:hypothetical protein